MCTDINNCTCGPAHEPISFDDLEDKSDWDGSKPDPVTDADIDTDEEREMRDSTGGHITSRSTVGRYKCDGCHGSGFIRVFRRGGGWGQRGERKKCWKGCGGTGYTKTSPEARAKNRDRARRKRQEKANRALEAGAKFLLDNPKIAAWFAKNEGNPDWRFPDDLKEKLLKYGHLTPGQIGAIEKCIRKDEERAEKYAAQEQDGIDLTHMHSGKKRYGRQRPGGKYQGDIVEELKAISADPKAAMAAYGHLVGRCGMCNRKLEDEKSIELGIGPVCASKM